MILSPSTWNDWLCHSATCAINRPTIRDYGAPHSRAGSIEATEEFGIRFVAHTGMPHQLML